MKFSEEFLQVMKSMKSPIHFRRKTVRRTYLLLRTGGCAGNDRVSGGSLQMQV